MRDIEACLYVGPSDRTTLERLVADGKTPQKIVKRAKIVLLSGCGVGTHAIMREARSNQRCGAGRTRISLAASSVCARTRARVHAPASSASALRCGSRS